jgi:hypothetical protein
VGSRALRFLPIPLPPDLDHVLGKVMIFHFIFLFNTQWWITAHVLGVLGLVVGLSLVTRGFARLEQGRVVLRRWFSLLVWLELAVHHGVFDLDPGLMTLYCVSVPLVLAGAWPEALARGTAGRRLALAGAGVMLVALWLGSHGGQLHVLQLLLWAIAAGGLLRARHRFPRGRDWLVSVLVAAFLVQVVSLGFGALPASFLAHGGRLLGPGRVYSFCEIPERKSLFAVPSSCTAESIEDCRDDYVVEYDLRTLSEVRRHHFFDDEFYGRMLYLLCLPDRVQVGMSQTRDGDSRSPQNVMEFRVDAPQEVVRHLLPEPVGVVMLHDPRRQGIFYTSEFSNQIVHLDYGVDPPAKNVFTLREARWFLPPFMLGPFFLRAPGSLATMVNARYDARGTGFFGEWIRGRKVIELDLESHEFAGEYWTNNGGSSSLSVDQGLGRLFATGLWGVEVFDLETGELLLRRRTEFAPRLPIVDEVHDLVYVTATFGNHISVWDRRTLAVRGEIAVGTGGRNAHLSSDGRYLFSSGFRNHYSWETESLARRFGTSSHSSPKPPGVVGGAGRK